MYIFLLSDLEVITFEKLGFHSQTLGHREASSIKGPQTGKYHPLSFILGSHSLKMKNSTEIDENIEGGENFRAWKYRIMLIFEEHDLDGFIKEVVKELEGEESKDKHKKDTIKVKRIIANSIKDQLISQVSSKNTPK